MKKLLFWLLFFLSSAVTVAQVDSLINTNIRLKKKLKLIAYQQITDLSKGALIVRLKTNKQSLQALRENNHRAAADKLQTQLFERNKNTVKIFNEFFDFCPVYFVYSDFSKQIINREFDEVVFLNKDLTPDLSIKFEHAHFLTAEYGRISKNSASPVYSKMKYGEDNFHSGISDVNFEAYVVMDESFKQLFRPFPYYAKFFPILFASNQVHKLNLLFHHFQERALVEYPKILKSLEK